MTGRSAYGFPLSPQLSESSMVNRPGVATLLPCAFINPWILTSQLPADNYRLSVAYSRPATCLGREHAAQYSPTFFNVRTTTSHGADVFVRETANQHIRITAHAHSMDAMETPHICKDAQSSETNQAPHTTFALSACICFVDATVVVI